MTEVINLEDVELETTESEVINSETATEVEEAEVEEVMAMWFPADFLACHLFDVRVSDVPSLSFLPALQLDARYLVRRTLFAWMQIVFNRDER